MVPNTTFTVTFNKAGEYDYICALHDYMGMKGTVVVEEN
jgi:plastocyanin